MRQRVEAGLAHTPDAAPGAAVQERLPRVVAEELAFALSQAFASSQSDPLEPVSSTLYCVLPAQLDGAHRIGGILDRQLFGDALTATPLIRAAHELVERDLAWGLPPATEPGD